MDMRSQSTIPEDLADFLEGKKLISPMIGQKRKISPSLITPPASIRSASSSSSSSITSRSFQATATRIETDAIEIPAKLYSPETYEIIGFNKETAAYLWDTYLNNHEFVDGADLLDFAIEHVRAVPGRPTSSLDDWGAYLDRAGINSALRAAILLPEFEDIRYTAGCKYWVVESVAAAFHVVKELKATAKAEAIRLQRNEQSTQGQSQQKRHKDSSGDSATPILDAEVEGPTLLPGHTMLWRAAHKDQCSALCDMETKRLVTRKAAMAPGDFSGLMAVAYFTPQKETADRYATWRKHMVPISDLRMVQVAVPEAFIQTLDVKYLWAGEPQQAATDEWRKVVFAGRNRDLLRKELEYIASKDLLIGNVAREIDAKFEDMKSHTEIKDKQILRVTIDSQERRAIQCAFHPKSFAGLEDATEGKFWVHRLGALKTVRERK